jgi:hypothetical protein
MSPDTARKLLELRFSPADHDRVAVLSVKAREGALTREERNELDLYTRAADLLAILQSRARRSLPDADSPS